jgi:hypothetical protein
MLQISVLPIELWDEKSNQFFYSHSKEQLLQLEHSLVSLSKWESKWCKPFLTKVDKTDEETTDYIKCMTLTQNVDPDIYKFLSRENIKTVIDYIELPMTATTFSKDDHKVMNREIITAEIIYYWMITLNIPFECQKWHLNRLLTLINVCNIKNQPKKMNKKDILANNRRINEARRNQYNTTG